jgi:hypothetical protein
MLPVYAPEQTELASFVDAGTPIRPSIGCSRLPTPTRLPHNLRRTRKGKVVVHVTDRLLDRDLRLLASLRLSGAGLDVTSRLDDPTAKRELRNETQIQTAERSVYQ